MAFRLLAPSHRTAGPLASRAVARLSTGVKTVMLPSASRFPTFPEMRETTLLQAEKVNNSPRVEFDPARKHAPSVGAETGIIPLASKPEWRTYWNPRNKHRIGMFLEETDVIATWVGYKHNQDPAVPLGTPAHHTMGVVTVRIDRIDVAPGSQFRHDPDVFMHGFVSWVGRSSLEVTIDVSQNDANQVPRTQMAAKYIMVAITPQLKSASHVALQLRDGNDRRLFDQGEHARELREQRDKNSVARKMPTSEELDLLRGLEFKVIDPLTLTSDYFRIPVCEVTNAHGKVFGGLFLHKAYETAWSNAAVFANQTVKCTSVTNGLFLRAVPVGALLHISSQVCYTRDRLMQTLVTCQVHNSKSNKLETTNIFHFTFEAEAPVRSLIPTTHADGLRFIHCRRELEFAMRKTTLDTNFD